jgi:hypothetical protein
MVVRITFNPEKKLLPNRLSPSVKKTPQYLSHSKASFF